jgi:hypothetical protein
VAKVVIPFQFLTIGFSKGKSAREFDQRLATDEAAELKERSKLFEV